MYRNSLVTLIRMLMVFWHILNKRARAEWKQGFEQGMWHRIGQYFRATMRLKLYWVSSMCTCQSYMQMTSLYAQSAHQCVSLTSLVIPNTNSCHDKGFVFNLKWMRIWWGIELESDKVSFKQSPENWLGG